MQCGEVNAYLFRCVPIKLSSPSFFFPPDMGWDESFAPKKMEMGENIWRCGAHVALSL